MSSSALTKFADAIAKGLERGLVDMDDHMEDVGSDWRNLSVQKFCGSEM